MLKNPSNFSVCELRCTNTGGLFSTCRGLKVFYPFKNPSFRLKSVFLYFLLFLLTSCSAESMQSLPDISGYAESANELVKRTIERIAESWSMVSREFDSASDNVKDVPQQIHDCVENEFHHSLDSAKNGLSDGMEKFTEKQKDISRQRIIESLTKENENKSPYGHRDNECSEQ